jgi:hypothetical protein
MGSGLRRAVRAIATLLAGAAVLWPLAATASAQSFTWTGQGSTANWSNTSNWSPAASPSGATSLTFGALPAPCPDTVNPTCYVGTNDVSGVSVNSISIDDAVTYDLTGDQVNLGAGGLTAAPSAATAGDPTFAAPLALTASQTWSINGGTFVGPIAGGGHALTVHLVPATYGQFGTSTLFLSGDTEVSYFDATGDGAVELVKGGRLNADGAPVVFGGQAELFPQISTSIGPLSTARGTPFLLWGDIEVGPVTLTVLGTANIGSEVEVGLYGAAGASELVASQVRARGELIMTLQGIGNHDPCPALTAGQSYVLVSSTQPIIGQFEPNGDTLQIYRDCNGSPVDDEALISDTAHTVKATVIAIPAKPPILAWLKRILKPTGKHASITQILAHRGYAFVSTPPAYGFVNVDWTTISKHKLVVVAMGGMSVGPHKTSLRISLTRAGRKLLLRSKRLRVTAGAGISYPDVGARKTFTLR